MTEAEIESDCNEIVELLGGTHRKLDVGPGAKGWPDQSYWLPGSVHLIVEFKKPGGRVSPKQRSRIAALGTLGHNVYILSSVASFVGVVASLGVAPASGDVGAAIVSILARQS